ncbi:MAG: bis(5'-nucleosyl)-tetraphosphatase (symmetrical) YqeK [Lachnospiraceae bacterium]|nr:bis(5'-nucleosyl)-tetraphosphatase (symmetrical) YqeK [Lachnospiraceae bacterium]
MMNEKKIKEQLEKQLDKKRMEHTEGVAYTAAALAMRYGVDVDKAYLAGLLHDCAKCIDKKKQYALCEKYGLELSESEKDNSSLVHAKLGAFLAKEKYSVEDEDILSAVLYHTTGRENMTMLEKIIFVADYVEPGRKPITGLDEIRALIFIDIDAAIYKILRNTIGFLEENEKPIDARSRNALLYYEKFTKN